MTHPLDYMMRLPRWLLWKAVPDPAKPTKPRKIPISAATGQACDPIDPVFHNDYATAHAALSAGIGGATGMAFVLTKEDPIFAVDIDGCLDANQPGGWSLIAQDLMQRLSGCAVEISHSGEGLHIFGCGEVPGHACKNIPLGIELYTENRYFAITFNNPVGDASTVATAAISQVVLDYFPPSKSGDVVGWTDEPRDGYDTSLSDDDHLIERATKTSAGRPESQFGGISFGDLFTGNVDAIAKRFPGNSDGGYDASSADSALASHLMFWTGHNYARIERLMRRSALAREKWDMREDYLERTILNAAGVHSGKIAMPTAESLSVIAATGAGADGETKPNRVIVTLARQGVTARYDMRRRVYELCLPEPMLWKGRVVGCLPIDDDAIRQICRMVAPYVKATMADVEQAIKTMGGLDKFDPVLDYFESLQWDGVARLDVLLHYYCRAEDTPLNRGYGRHFLLGAVARTFWPGCSHDEVLALIGPQGAGKSRFTKILGGDWHSDAPLLGLDTQKVIERIGNALIHEIAEVRLSGRDGEQVKAFLSTTHHTARAAFGRVADTVPARWVHVSTGNDEKFLTDMTGNRRWHVVGVSNIRLEELRAARDQLWAEAVAIFKSLYPNWQSVAMQDRRILFPRELWTAQAQTAEAARLRDPWEDMIPEAIRTGRIVLLPSNSQTASVASYFVSTGAILQALNARGSVQDTKRVASICVQLGWIPHKQRFNGQILRGYLIPEVLVPSS